MLGTGTASQTISATASNAITLSIEAQVNGLGTIAPFTSVPADGAVHNIGFVLSPTDFDDDPIANGSTDPYANPITVTLQEIGGSGHAQLSLNGTVQGGTVTLTKSSDAVAVVYDGAGSAGYSIGVAFSATGTSTLSTTISPLYLASASPLFVSPNLTISGTASATFTASEMNAPNGTVYTATPTGCGSIATVSAVTMTNATGTFSVTGIPGTGSCSVQVSDGTSIVSFGVFNNTPTPAPTATPTLTPAPTPTPTPVPTATPSPVPTGSPLAGNNVWIEPNLTGPFMTFSINTALAVAPSPDSNAPTTSFTPAGGVSAYIALDYTHNILWMGGGSGIIGVNSGSSGTLPTLETDSVPLGAGGLAVDSAGNVYVCAGSATIQIFAYGSTTATTTMSLGSDNCHGIAVDTSGNIYAADPSNENIYVIAAPGVNAGTVSPNITRTITAAAGGFSKAWNIAVDSTGKIYLADPTKDDLFVYAAGTTNAASATPATTITANNGGTLNSVAIDANNNVLAPNLYQILLFKASSVSSAITNATNVTTVDEIITNGNLTNAVGIAAH